VPQLGHVILYVSDPAASAQFYRNVVGLQHRFTDAGYAEFGMGETRFELYEQHRAEWLTGASGDAGPCRRGRAHYTRHIHR
jgi:lactoylglutathione lyase